jgi:hypothetical protein
MSIIIDIIIGLDVVAGLVLLLYLTWRTKKKNDANS